MGEKNKKETPTNETAKKVYWIIGIAVIVFLVMLLGSLIGLKITRDGLNSVIKNYGKNSGEIQSSYEVLADGTKVNISDAVKNAEFTKDGIRVTNFSIMEADGISTVSYTIENISQETVKDISVRIALYDSNDVRLADFSPYTSSLEAGRINNMSTQSTENLVEATRIETDITALLDVSGE